MDAVTVVFPYWPPAETIFLQIKFPTLPAAFGLDCCCANISAAWWEAADLPSQSPKRLLDC